MATADQPAWIALGDSGPLAELASDPTVDRLLVVRDPATFASLLCAGKPSVAVLQSPPAGDTDLQLALRERRRRTSLRLLHLTPPSAVEARIEALRQGVDEALAETIAPAELLARLTLLETRGQTRHGAGIPVADGVILDPVAHEVRRGPDLVHLRPKEYQLLALLANHPGRAYSRRELLDRVWGPDHDGDPRTIDVHVRWLRSKLEPQPATPIHLVTVRGVGYRLDPTPR